MPDRLRYKALAWFIALRFLFSLKGQRFLWVLTLFGLLLVGGIVAVTYTVVCVAEGFSQDLRRQFLTTRPHVEVALASTTDSEMIGALAADPAVSDVVPLVTGSALLDTQGHQEGVEVWGIGAERTRFLERFECEWLSEMNRDGLFRESTPGRPEGAQLPGIILGSELFQVVYPSFPGTLSLSLVYPFGDVDPFGNLVPAIRSFDLIGMCESGIYPLDRKVVMVSLAEARRLFPQYQQSFNRLWVYLHQPMAVDAFMATWRPSLERLGSVSTWKSANKTLLGALELERKAFGTVIVMVFILASLSLYGMLSLLALEKRGDFAILATLGIPQSRFLGILLRMTAMLSLVGSIGGGLLGVLFVAVLSRYPLPLPEAYYIRDLSVTQVPLYGWAIVLASVGVQLLAALLPGLWLRRLSPVEALRFVEGGVV